MTNQQRNILKLAAALDIVIALGLFIGIIVLGFAVPIIAPVLLGCMGIVMLVMSLVLK